MTRFRDISITRKLTLIIMATSTAALLIACVSFLAYEWVSFRGSQLREQCALGRMIAANTISAIQLNDPQQATQVLSPLKAERRIKAACIYTAKMNVLATYVRPDQVGWQPPPPPEGGIFYRETNLGVFLPIVQEGTRIGMVFLQSDGSDMSDRLMRYAVIVLGVLGWSMLVAFSLSALLQRSISTPVVALAETAAQVSQRRDYSLRAAKTAHDEVGKLIDAFNEMLAEIQTRDNALRSSEAHFRDLAAKLQQSTESLERSNRELQDFAYVASHDLQEPLRKIQAFGDRLKEKCADALGEQGKDYLTRMQDAASRMQSLITDLLQFSRVTTKAQPFEPVNLDRVAHEVLSDLEVRVEQAGARVELEDLPTIEADPLQMRQLLQNLIGNALKFRKPDISPVIRLRGRLEGGSLPPGGRNGQRCELTVADNGIGFDEKYVDKIFVIFQRLHGRNEYEGTGVGLAICRKIVERHRGRITARSAPGQGATFVVDLPVHQLKEAIGK